MRSVLHKLTPNDPQLWFLLGYAARLDAKFRHSEMPTIEVFA